MKILIAIAAALLFCGRIHAAETCTASVFSEGFGRPLADGRRHRPDEILVAHKSLPLGSSVRVTIPATGRSIVAPVRDRGPYVRGRCVDLSRGAARALGVNGLAKAIVEPIPRKGPSP